MKIIKASYEILTNINKKDILKKVELAGRTCYKSEDKITDESASNFVKMLIKRGHEAMIEHASISVKFITDRGCCYSDDTKVLTENGFKFFKDIQKDEKIYTLNENNELILSNYIKIIKKPYFGEIFKFKTTQINLKVTPNHNMWVYDYNKRSDQTRIWKFIKAKDLNNKQYKFYKSSNVLNDNNIVNIKINSCNISRGFWTQQYPEINFNNEKSKLFLKLIGLWVTDGSISYGKNGSGNKIIITQIKKKIREEIEFLLKNIGFKYKKYDTYFQINCPQLFKWLEFNFIKNKNARKTYYLSIPKWIKNLPTNYLQNFIDGCVLGDGHRRKTGEIAIYTVSLKFAEDLVECYLKLGKCANIRTVMPKKQKRNDNLNIQSKVPVYVLHVVNTLEALYNKKDKTYTKEQYNGNVYCLELPKFHKLYVMRNGKSCWCGNSHEIVRHRLASYAQESTRYCNYSKDKFKSQIIFIKSNFWNDDNNLFKDWEKAMLNAEKSYLNLLENGAKPQQARSVLPNSLKTEIVMTANLREWRHFFKLRTAKVAHPQIREITIPLLKELQEKLPEVFGDLEVKE
jgi:thymidylate synthase ThyX